MSFSSREGVPRGHLEPFLDFGCPDHHRYMSGAGQQVPDQLQRSVEIKSKGNAGHRGTRPQAVRAAIR